MHTAQFEDSFAALENITAAFGGIDQPETKTAMAALMPPEQAAQMFLADPSRRNNGGYYEVTRPGPNPDEQLRRQQAGGLLCGQLVIAPMPNGQGGLQYYPAAVSLNQPHADQLRLHVHHEPFQLQQPERFSGAAQILLPGALQSELQGIGDHKGAGSLGIEPEHGITLLRASVDPTVGQAWQMGQHPNHQWRATGNTVLSAVSTSSAAAPSLFQDGDRQNRLSTVTFPMNKLPLYWHESLANYDTTTPALHLVQAAGFMTVHEQGGTETLKRLAEVNDGNS